MKKYNIEIIKLGVRTLAFILLGLFIALIGNSLNHIAINNNYGLMGAYTPIPLPNGYMLQSDGVHFFYNSMKYVKYAYLTDIFTIGHKIYSIGDFFIILGKFWIILFTILSIPYLWIKSFRIRRYYNYGY